MSRQVVGNRTAPEFLARLIKWMIGNHACASRIPNSLAESRIEATLRGAWRLASSNEVRSHASLKGHAPLTFADGHMVARAELNNVR